MLPLLVSGGDHSGLASDIQSSEGGQFAAEYVPERIRYLLIAESAANDGLAYPFLSIAIYLSTEASPAIAFEKWIVISCLCV